jgi:lysozyme
MKVSQVGIKLIQTFESCRLQAYQDSKAIWTIGWGNTQYENGIRVKKGDVLTQQRADELFATILLSFEYGVTKRVGASVTQAMFDALISFSYNLGLGNLDKSTLLKKVNANPLDATIRLEFMKWVNKGSSFEKGLTRRRKAEADLYFTTTSSNI